jgi:HK97 family phage major capsid protein
MAQARQAIETAGADAQVRAAATRSLEDARLDEQIASELEKTLLSQMAGMGGAAFGTESFLDNPETIRQLEALAHSSSPIGSMNLGPLMSAEEYAAMISSGAWGSNPKMAAATDPTLQDTSRIGPYRGIIPQLQRRLRILDLIPTGTMVGNSFYYTRMAGSLDTAAEVADLSLKAQGDAELSDAQVVARTIAHWNKVSRPQLDDVAGLATTMQTRLVYGCNRRVENAVLAGNGVGQNLLGILNTTGIASVAFSSGIELLNLPLDGITDILTSEAEPNAVVFNPTDWAAIVKRRAGATDGTWQGEYLVADPGGMAAPTLWGVPVVQSTAMPAGQALVGDFSLGATLFIREGVNFRISDSDQDDFLRNRITMLAETRVGLAVWQPTCFALVHLA